MSLAFHSLGCGIGYGYLHRIPTQPSGHYKKPAGISPSGTPAANTPQPSDFPLGTPPPWPILQDSSSLELGSRHSDYMEVLGSTCHGRDGRSFWGNLPMGLEEARLPWYAVEWVQGDTLLTQLPWEERRGPGSHFVSGKSRP